jgi:hypothetical protein
MPEGARVNANDVKACLGNHRTTDVPPRGQLITMGIDIGKVIHYWIDQWLLPQNLGADLNMYAKARNLKHGFVNHFEELDQLMSDYQVVHAVSDWQPEERLVHNFCQRFFGRAHRCYFHRGMKNKTINVQESLIGVGRTSWLDLSQGRFKNRTIALPSDTTTEAKNHIMNLVRIEKKDKDENPVSKYISLGTDHYALARMYSEVALPLAISAAKNTDVSAFL